MFWLLRDYIYLSNELQKGFIVSANTILGGDGGADSAFTSALEVFWKFTAMVLHSILHVWDGYHPVNDGIVEAITGFAKIISVIVVLIIMLIYMLFVIFGFIGMYVASKITLLITLVIGPVFIPFGVLSYTSFMFIGWLRFLLGSSIFYFIMPITTKMIDEMGVGLFNNIGSGSLTMESMTKGIPEISWTTIISFGAFITVLIPVINLAPKISMMLASGMPHGTVGTGATGSAAASASKGFFNLR